MNNKDIMKFLPSIFQLNDNHYEIIISISPYTTEQLGTIQVSLEVIPSSETIIETIIKQSYYDLFLSLFETYLKNQLMIQFENLGLKIQRLPDTPFTYPIVLIQPFSSLNEMSDKLNRYYNSDYILYYINFYTIEFLYRTDYIIKDEFKEEIKNLYENFKKFEEKE